MKVATILGTRPEIIRLSQVIARLDAICEHQLVHTGQNFDHRLSDVFFQELGVRAPDECWGVRATSFGTQCGEMVARAEEFFNRHKPDRLLILGDTNSGLTAMAAARMRIPVYHMEAGNRCYDDRVPEEINRRIIDHCSSVLMPYTHRSKDNLLKEGFARERVFVTGNPIAEVIDANAHKIKESRALEDLAIEPGGYFLVTTHRAENVDDPTRLQNIVEGLVRIAEEHNKPVVVSTHPRTADKLQKASIAPKSSLVRFLAPLGFFDFVHLEENAACVLTDSGTVQEEATLLHVPSVVLRDVTERGECLEAGSGILSGAEPESIVRSVRTVLDSPTDWEAPTEYLQKNVSATVANIVTGFAREAAA